MVGAGVVGPHVCPTSVGGVVVGTPVGLLVGAFVGVFVGSRVGVFVGARVGAFVAGVSGGWRCTGRAGR